MNIKTANRLCSLRKEHNLSQEELASKLGVSRQAVSKWERSEASPDTDNLIELAKIYGVTLDELVNGDESIELINENKEANNEKSYRYKDDNYEVFINGDEMVLTDKEGLVRTYSKEKFCKSKDRMHKIKGLFTSCYVFLAIIIYLLLGFFIPNGYGWANFWFLFILIPFVSSIFECIATKRASAFGMVFLVAATYCALGMMMSLWHPLWILFLLIPLYSIFAQFIDIKTHAHDFEVLEDAIEEERSKDEE